MSNDAIDRAVLLLTGGMSVAKVEAWLAQQQGIDPAQAAELVQTARRRITVAADYTRDEQIGKAVMRLEDLYAKSLSGKDTRTALQAQRELNRLLDLYGGSSSQDESDAGDGQSGELREQLARVAEHLVPLGLCDDDLPLEEHARLAAVAVRQLQAQSGV